MAAAASCCHNVDLLIIAGPSESGKTTLIEQLQLGTLDSTLRRHLPEGCESWPVVGVTRATPKAVDAVNRWAVSERRSGLILHYDNSYIYRTGQTSLDRNTAKELFMAGGCPMVISMRPTLDQLRRQFQQRRERQQAGKSALRRVWRDRFRIPVKIMLQRARGQPGVDIRNFHESEDWLNDCYSRWDALVASLRHSCPTLLALDVEPCGSERDPGFRIREEQSIK